MDREARVRFSPSVGLVLLQGESFKILPPMWLLVSTLMTSVLFYQMTSMDLELQALCPVVSWFSCAFYLFLFFFFFSNKHFFFIYFTQAAAPLQSTMNDAALCSHVFLPITVFFFPEKTAATRVVRRRDSWISIWLLFVYGINSQKSLTLVCYDLF